MSTSDRPSKEVGAVHRASHRGDDPVDLVVEGALQRLLDDGERQDGTRLWDAVRGTSRGGKRLRPRILLDAYDALAGVAPPEPRDVALRVAAALELLHHAFLAHDDVIDGADTRRGRPNAAGMHAAQALESGASTRQAQGYGAAAGILAGDLALAASVRAVALCGAAPAATERLLDVVDEAMHLTADGELADVRLSLGGCADLDETLRTAERKTAVYSFQLPLRAAVILAGREDLDGGVQRLGRDLGLAFQLRDDLDGVFGDPAETGKSNASDLREGKCTPLIALAHGTAAWGELSTLLGDPDAGDAALQWARELLEACGARAAVETLAANLERDAVVVGHDLGLGALAEAVAGARLPREPSAA
ncbi:polyprenyl synthetase family protein [Isoptericola sp. NPDC057391]|uniref:polyprenyl synthetase family protein n=1 Tax=Isoptericola sp. NPDC057391 TaxID=3346117 RepID=UPI0036447B75